MTRLVSVLLLSGAAVCGDTRSGPEQNPRPPVATVLSQDSVPIPASLLRRLGEAADGYRDGKPKWVVANRTFPHKVAGVFPTAAEAAAAADRAGPGYDDFGPFQTVDDPPDQSSVGSENVVAVIVVKEGGKQVRYGADTVDAMFWSLAAFDKFIVPYLAFVYGSREAEKQRELYRTGKSPFANSREVAHKAGSF
jgi:hypothetical protein